MRPVAPQAAASAVPACQPIITGGLCPGTAKLNHILDEDAHAPAHLEASDQRTRQFYLDKDYSDHGPPIRLPGGPLMYPMMREPRPPAPDAATGRS
jgi:hypothetical protein